MILLTARDLSRQFDREPVFSGLFLEVRDGDRVGLVGPNGTGKTTLMNCLCGIEHPDKGEVISPGGVTIAILEQQPNFPPARTLIEEAKAGLQHLYDLQDAAHALAEQMATAKPADHDKIARKYDDLMHEIERNDAYNVDYRIDEVLGGLGFQPDEYDRPIVSFSGGQQSRVMLARILLRSPDVMLLDEPTNHLDIASTEWLESYLSRFEKGMIIVSHDRYFLDRTTNRILELHGGRGTEYKGNFSSYWKQREERLMVLERQFEKQQDFIEKTEDFIRRNKAGQKSVQAKDREKKLERLDRIDIPQDFQEVRMTFGEASRTGDMVLDVDGLAKGFADGTPLFEDIKLRLLRGERMGIVGPNGCGKTTLLRTLLDEIPADAGTVRIGANVKIGYYDQKLTSVDPGVDAVEAVRPLKKPEFTPGMARGLLARFGVKGELQMQTVSAMSGGEKSRVALARLAAADVNVLVLDEPTNHLDLWARESLEAALKNFTGTLIFVSHDRYFLDQLANRVLVWDEGTWRLHDGNYSEFVDFSKRTASAEQAAAASKAKGKNVAKGGAPAKPASDDRNRDGGSNKNGSIKNGAKPKKRGPARAPAAIEADIAFKEDEIAALEADLLLPEVLRDPGRMKAITAGYGKAKQELADLYEQWEAVAGGA